MAVAQIGTTLSIGAGTISGSYIVESRDDASLNVIMEDVLDQDGVIKTRIVFEKRPVITLNLICISGAVPATDFPKGAKSTHTDFTSYFVNECRVSRSKGAQKVAVTLEALGL